MLLWLTLSPQGCLMHTHTLCRLLKLCCALSFRERAEAAASKREARPTAFQAAANPESQGSRAGPLPLGAHPSSLSLAASIDDLVVALKPHRSAGGVAREDSSLSTSGSAL